MTLYKIFTYLLVFAIGAAIGVSLKPETYIEGPEKIIKEYMSRMDCQVEYNLVGLPPAGFHTCARVVERDCNDKYEQGYYDAMSTFPTECLTR